MSDFHVLQLTCSDLNRAKVADAYRALVDPSIPSGNQQPQEGQINGTQHRMWFILALYGFSAACIINFLLMRAKLNTGEYYHKLFKLRTKRTEALLAAHPEKSAEELQADAYIPQDRPVKIVFLHPDLGIGGAERLIVDAAVGLQSNQKFLPKVDVTIVTNHHDRARAFEETTNGTIKVRVAGNYFPVSVFGRFKVLCASVRMALAAFSVCWYDSNADLFVVDQVAFAMPILYHLAQWTPILFYCHFPDQQCDPNRDANGNFILGESVPKVHKAYREFFDAVEGWSMGFATNVVCNSQFSRRISLLTFPALEGKIDAVEDVFYPPIAAPVADTKSTEEADGKAGTAKAESESTEELVRLLETHTSFVSLNRYERKKQIELAIEAFMQMLAAQQAGTVAKCTKPPLLIIAGGYDKSLPENVAYADELAALAKAKAEGIDHGTVRFLRNINHVQKELLLSKMCAMVYTPAREHFGIVPVESMSHKKPVIAVNFGGPRESLGAPPLTETPSETTTTETKAADGETPAVPAAPTAVVQAEGGFVCAPTAEAFASAMEKLATDPQLAQQLGEQGYRRVQELFTLNIFSDKLAHRVWKLCNEAQLRISTELAGTTSLAPPSAADRSAKKTN